MKNLLYILVITLLAILYSCSSEVTPERPNILFIPVDDLRPDLGCYGDDFAVTPNIDKVAEQGVTFDRTYCQQAVCNPSRVSLLTGLRPDTLRVWDLRTEFRNNLPDVVTLPQYFKENGYYVYGIGFTIDSNIEEINAAHQNGLYVMMWGAKSDAGNKKAISLNTDFLQTDKPIPLLMLFSRFNYDYNIL